MRHFLCHTAVREDTWERVPLFVLCDGQTGEIRAAHDRPSAHEEDWAKAQRAPSTSSAPSKEAEGRRSLRHDIRALRIHTPTRKRSHTHPHTPTQKIEKGTATKTQGSAVAEYTHTPIEKKGKQQTKGSDRGHVITGGRDVSKRTCKKNHHERREQERETGGRAG